MKLLNAALSLLILASASLAQAELVKCEVTVSKAGFSPVKRPIAVQLEIKDAVPTTTYYAGESEGAVNGVKVKVTLKKQYAPVENWITYSVQMDTLDLSGNGYAVVEESYSSLKTMKGNKVGAIIAGKTVTVSCAK